MEIDEKRIELSQKIENTVFVSIFKERKLMLRKVKEASEKRQCSSIIHVILIE